MNPLKFISLLLLIAPLVACGQSVPTPDADDYASEEAVELSLSTVDPTASLHLFEYDSNAPLDIVETARWEQDDALWIDFNFVSPKGGRVLARMGIPAGKGPFPGMLLQHGGLSNYEDMTGLARVFVNYGAVVLMINDPYTRPGVWQPTEYMGYTWPFFTDQDHDIKIQMIIDQRRAIDILAARPEVDPGRMAYYGISFGGAMGGLLAGVEDRLKAYVLEVGDGGLVEHTSPPNSDGLPDHFSQNWAMKMWPTESLHHIGSAAPAALLFLNGTQDEFVTPSDAIRYQIAASEPKTVIWYESGHGLPQQSFIDAARWLQPILGDDLIWFAPNYRPSAVVMDWFFSAWILVVILSIAILIWDNYRKNRLGWSELLTWTLVMALLGPLGLLVYFLSVRTGVRDKQFVRSQVATLHAFGTSVITASSLAVGFFIVDSILKVIPDIDFRLMLVINYAAVACVGWIVLLLARRIYRLGFLSYLLIVNIVWSLTIFLSSFTQGTGGLNSTLDPRILWLLSIQTVLASLATYPLHLWFIKCGTEIWNFPPLAIVDQLSLTHLSRSRAVVLLSASYLLILLSVISFLMLVANVPLREVIVWLFGIGA